MNCFEARNGFAAFWRKTLEPDARAAMLIHLKECAPCDRAFRVFSLTGAALYSDAPLPEHEVPSAGRRESSRAAGASRRHESVRSAGVSRHENARPAWRALCAMAAMIVAAGFAAYLSMSVPRQTLDEAVSNPEPAIESTSGLIGQEDLALNDLGI